MRRVVWIVLALAVLGAAAGAAASSVVPAGKYQGTARKSKGAGGGFGGTYQFGFNVVGSSVSGITLGKVPMSCTSNSTTTSVTKTLTVPGGFPSASVSADFFEKEWIYTGGRWKPGTPTGATPYLSVALAYHSPEVGFQAAVAAADLSILVRADSQGRFDPKGPLYCKAASDVTPKKR